MQFRRIESERAIDGSTSFAIESAQESDALRVSAVKHLSMWLIALFAGIFLLPAPAAFGQYSVHREGEVVRLEDAKSQTEVSVLTAVGDLVFSMKVKGHDVVHFPYPSIDAYKARPGLAGVPFLGPWANRLDEQAFYANGKKYNLNMGLGNVRGRIPIHGFLLQSPYWEIVEAKADREAAWLTCRLSFYRHPDYMEQFPFAHTIEITQRLSQGVLEVRTRLENLSTDPMPVAIGFHPYYQLTDSKREDWRISIGARSWWQLNADKIPTGETKPIEQLFPDPKSIALKDVDLDHVFGDLIRDSAGRTTLAVEGKRQRLEVEFGPKFRAAVVYSPLPRPPAASSGAGAAATGRPAPDPNFICFEPMAGITDSMNLAERGLYKEQQSIAPGGVWEESFWIRPMNF